VRVRSANLATSIPLDVVLTSVDRPDMRLNAELRSFGDDFLELVAPIALSEGLNVDVALGHGANINTRVINCTRDRHSHTLRLGINGDRRRHARVAVEQPAVIRTLHPEGPQQDVTIIDVSLGGLGMLIADELLKGTQLEIVVPGAVVFGDVRHCARTDGHYHVGVRMQSVVTGKGSGN
jgi:PilZ domain